ncbi:MAG: HTTM domain-containing protein [Deltaproteobacteria bacterium]|nr:HTTM domain-containing protein [Deltaproteobacteria bacterium]
MPQFRSIRSARPVDIAWLAAFRILFGSILCVSMLRFVGYGWIDGLFVDTSFRFKYFGLAWVQPPGEIGTHVLFWVLALLALCIAVGLFFRASAAAFAIGFAYLQAIDVTNYLNHYYLALLLGLLLAVSPAHRAWSLDARRNGWRIDVVPAAWLWLFRFQVGVVYTFAGLAKAQADWLWHAQPLNIWLASRTGIPILGPLFVHSWAAPLMSWAGFLFDSTIVAWLMWPRTRPYAYAIVIVFHVLTRVLFPIGMFPVIMILAALVFFPANWPRGFVRHEQDARAPTPESTPRWRPVGWALAGIYCAVQLVLPLRHLAYGGNVLWHEQGMRFSWRVMVREKNGSVTFQVRSEPDRRQFEVSAHDYLNRLQERELSGQPDLILQLAHHIRDDYTRRGLRKVEVRVDAIASLNGRPPGRLIDPDVDLAKVNSSILPARWILPAPTSAPPRLRAL